MHWLQELTSGKTINTTKNEHKKNNKWLCNKTSSVTKHLLWPGSIIGGKQVNCTKGFSLKGISFKSYPCPHLHYLLSQILPELSTLNKSDVHPQNKFAYRQKRDCCVYETIQFRHNHNSKRWFTCCHTPTFYSYY